MQQRGRSLDDLLSRGLTDTLIPTQHAVDRGGGSWVLCGQSDASPRDADLCCGSDVSNGRAAFSGEAF
jgi:hypothetical protein